MQARILERLNSAVQRKEILRYLSSSEAYLNFQESPTVKVIFNLLKLSSSGSKKHQFQLKFVLEEKGQLQIAHFTFAQILKITLSPQITVKQIQMVSFFHQSHTLEDVYRNCFLNTPKKSALFKATKKQHFQYLNPNNETQHPSKIRQEASLTNQAQLQKIQKDESVRQKKLEKRTNPSSTQQSPMPTNFAQARLELDKKVAKTQAKEKQKHKMTIESDEEYYEKTEFQKIMSVEGQKGKETDQSGKKESESKAYSNLPNKKLYFDRHSEDSDEEDIFAKMNKVSPLKKQKIKPQIQKVCDSHPQKVKSLKPLKKIDHHQKKNVELQKKNISTKSSNSKGSSLLGWLSQK